MTHFLSRRRRRSILKAGQMTSCVLTLLQLQLQIWRRTRPHCLFSTPNAHSLPQSHTKTLHPKMRSVPSPLTSFSHCSFRLGRSDSAVAHHVGFDAHERTRGRQTRPWPILGTQPYAKVASALTHIRGAILKYSFGTT